MRVIFVLTGLRDGGAEREAAAFANALTELGEEVHMVCIGDTASDYTLAPGVSCHQLTCSSRVNIPKLRVLLRWFSPVRQIRNLHGDVILPVCIRLDFYPRLFLAAALSKAKLFFAVRNNLPQKYVRPKDRRRWRRACRFARGIWIQTEEQRGYFPKYMQKKIFAVPNILGETFFEIPRDRKQNISRFISVGRIHPQKNQKLLITAFAQMLLRTENTDATLTIYGNAAEKDEDILRELQALIRQYHLEGRIFLPGRVADIQKAYREADAFVFSSDYEGYPNALMEAMAAGLPCISTDCPTGPSALITDKKDGLLVPVGDALAMSRAMQRLLENPEAANQMGLAARTKMSERENAGELAGRLLENLKRI